MDSVYRVFRNVKTFYDTINPATLSGAIDVIVVEQPDGEYKSTPFHVRFGKYGVFSHSEKYVDIAVNGEEIDLKMKLGDSGVASFVEECETEDVPDYMITSPVPDTPRHETDTHKILSESAQRLEEKEGSRRRRSGSLDNSSKSDISTAKEASGTTEAKREPKEEQSLSEVQQRSRNLPFSSSVFSNRKNRSLPDLSTISDNHDGYHSDGEGESSTHSRTPVRKTSMWDRKQLNELRNARLERNENSARKKKAVRIAAEPINIKIQDETGSESELDSSVSSSVSTPSASPSLTLDPRETERIAEGALSDSEVDHHRNTPEPHANDVTDWKWGQLPETREKKTKEPKEEKPKESSGWAWFTWRNRAPTPSPSENSTKKQEEQGITLDELMNKAQTDPVHIEKYLGKPGSSSMSVDSGHASRGVSQPSSPGAQSSEGGEETATPTQETINSVLNPPAKPEQKEPSVKRRRKIRMRSGQTSTSSNEDIFPLSEDDLESIEDESGKTYVRSLRLSSEKLKSLGLVRGANECRFSITTKFQGTSWCICNIYLYKWYEQIVISDIDGTITKSDVLGHVIPAIGGTWAHLGVADLYTRIKNNGYKMVYLSSRAIGQSHTTKQYLRSVAQDSRQLPDGPVLLSPTSVLMAFRREVIERRPEEFKIAALSDVKKLFPVEQPYFAGFGNRETDVTSYRAVGIPPSRILIVDPSGRVRRSDSIGYVSSYFSMANETVDYLFPPLAKNAVYIDPSKMGNMTAETWPAPLEHSSFTHWKISDSDEVAITDEDILQYEEKRKTAALERSKKK